MNAKHTRNARVYACIACMLIVLLSSCKSQSDAEAYRDREMPTGEAERYHPYTIQEAYLYAGEYVWGHEVSVFTLCGEQAAAWVHVPQDVELASMYQEHTKEAEKPYTPVYAEFMGNFLDWKFGGFDEQYDYSFFVKDVVAMEMLETQCTTRGNTR